MSDADHISDDNADDSCALSYSHNGTFGLLNSLFTRARPLLAV